MTTEYLDKPQLRAKGFEVLSKALGWVNAVRFVQEYEPSHFNYTVERDSIFPESKADEFMREFRDFEIPPPSDKS